MMSARVGRISVVIPARNETGRVTTVAAVLAEARAIGPTPR